MEGVSRLGVPPLLLPSTFKQTMNEIDAPLFGHLYEWVTQFRPMAIQIVHSSSSSSLVTTKPFNDLTVLWPFITAMPTRTLTNYDTIITTVNITKIKDQDAAATTFSMKELNSSSLVWPWNANILQIISSSNILLFILVRIEYWNREEGLPLSVVHSFLFWIRRWEEQKRHSIPEPPHL